MSRFGWLFLIVVVLTGGAVAAVPRPPVKTIVGNTIELLPVDDPFPIRRLRGEDSHLPDLLKELEPGPIVRLPRAEFESRVRAAGRANAIAKHTARVVDARYFAELDGGELSGTAEIGLLNTHGVTGFVPLDPLRLAVRNAKWANGGEAILAVPSGTNTPAVWMDRDGRQVLRLDWSLTGTTEPGERRFELRVPPCPTSSLELTLPARQVPTVSSDVLLTGPFMVSGKPAMRLWRLRFGGRPKVEFAVRAIDASGSIAQAKLEAKYELTTGQLTATFEYELHPARGSVSEWAFLADPGLRIVDVVVNNRAGWTVDPPTTPNGPRRVRINLRQPGPGGKVLISAVAPFPDAVHPGDSLPTIRPLNAVLDDEKLQLRIGSGLKIEAWNDGDYRLLGSTSLAGILPGAVDTLRVLSLAGTLLPPGTDVAFRRMPSLRVAPTEADFTTMEQLEWRLDPAKTILAAQVDVQVRRGPLFQLNIHLPPGYTLDRGAVGPDEVVSHIGSASGGVQVVELAQPLLAGQSAKIHLEFRGPSARPGTPLTFPAFAVNGATERDGWLSVTAAPQWTVALQAGVGAVPGGFWGWLTTDAPTAASAVYLFRGKEPEGTATLLAAKPTVAADAVLRLDTVGGKWHASTQLTLTPADGVLPALVVFVPGPADQRSWKLLDSSNTITDIVPIPQKLLEVASLLVPLDLRTALAGAHTREGVAGTYWLLRFAQPLAGTTTIKTTAPGPVFNDKEVALPVPQLLGAKQTIRPETVPALKDRTKLTVAGEWAYVQPVSHSPFDPPLVFNAYLVTVVRQPSDVLAAFGGTVRDSRGVPIRVALSKGMEVRGVCVAGRWLNPASCALRDPDGALRIPLPAAPEVRFEVRYRLTVETSWPTSRVVSPTPSFEGVSSVKRWWAFTAGTLPGWPTRPWNMTADDPSLLGGSLTGGQPVTFIARSDDEWVRVGTIRTADALASALTAALVVFGLLAAHRRRAWGAAVLAVGVIFVLVVAELGPPWWARVMRPLSIACVVMLACVLATVSMRRQSVVPVVSVTIAVASLLFFLFYSLSAIAQTTTPATVIIQTDESGEEEVIAPRALLDRLTTMAHPPFPTAVITSAAYDLHIDENSSHVSAKLIVHAFRSSDNTLSLPLGDARLERVTVNGVVAFPTASRPDTYTLALPRAGQHEVELRFATTVTAIGPERELHFGIPEVPQTKLTAALPGAAKQPQVVGRVGRLTTANDGQRTTLEADIGVSKSIHLRWREGAGGAGTVKVREGCVWDISEAGAKLTAAYLVRVERGTIAGLRFDIPGELEVLRVATRSLDAPIVPVPLRDWTLTTEKNQNRLLRVDFQNPIAGRLLVVLECVPRKPITRQPVLRFPRINFGNVTGETEAVYGLRSSRLVIDGVGLVGVIDFPLDALKDFTAVPDLRLDSNNPDNPARVFRPVLGATAELHPTLHIGEPVAVKTTTLWQAGPHRADAMGTLSWTAKVPLPLIEFNLPSVKVLEVRGTEVAAWNQNGSRVQVWLRSSVREGKFNWIGTVTLAPMGKPLPTSIRFDPAHPRMIHAYTTSDVVRVQTIDGWTAKIDRSRGWQTTPLTASELQFQTKLPASELRLQLQPQFGNN